jgi:hypothetical protein
VVIPIGSDEQRATRSERVITSSYGGSAPAFSGIGHESSGKTG